MKWLDTERFSGLFIGLLISSVAISLLTVMPAPWRAQGQGGNPVTTVSAASFADRVAPGSIAAAFGERLATREEIARSQPLPTQLAGTTVRVNGEAAPLFYVSPKQVNYLIPPGTPAGTASIVVTAGDGAILTGTAQIAPVAPALFTTESGKGPLAAQLLRIKPNGERSFEPLAQYSEAEKRFITKPIDLGGPNEQLFLVLYLTGVRNAPPSSLSVSIGGVANPIFNAAPVSGLVGLDQVNVRLEPLFPGRGRITLFVQAAGYTASNAGEFEIGAGGSTGGSPDEPAAPVQISSVPSSPVSVGDAIEIGGSGFAANPRENQAQIVAEGGLTSKADVLGVSANSLRLRVPYGAGTGHLKISRGPSEASAPIRVRTSISGFVEENIVRENGVVERKAIKGATIRVRLDQGGEITAQTGIDGSYVLKDPPLKPIVFVVDGSTANANPPPFASDIRMTPVVEGRDIQHPGPIVLQRKDGMNIAVGGLVEDAALPAEAEQSDRVTLMLPPGATVRFPDGSTRGTLNVTAFGVGRTPASLPAGHFSSTIAQIAPLGATITPGAKLTFRNDDKLPANTQAQLFRFEQRGSEVGSFVDVGAATVSADGRQVETAATAITETSYYFVSIPRPTAAINGRVVESDGRPVPRAIVQARGQTTFTDGYGGFVLRDVPVLKASGDHVRVEVSYQRPDGRVSRNDGNEVELTAGALVTVRPEIALDPVTTNFPPVILAPASLTLEAGETREFDFAATDSDSAQAPEMTRAGTAAAFTELISQGQGVYQLRMSPGANAVGSYLLNLTATDSAGAQITKDVAVTVNQRSDNQPVAHSQAVTMAEDTMKRITLSGRDPDGRELRPELVSMPKHGCLISAVHLGSNLCWRFPIPTDLTYKPAPNFNGVDSFTFRVHNGSEYSQPATVNIAVNPVNDRPVLNVPGEQQLTAGETLNLLVSATDVDGEQALRFTAAGLPPGATFREAGGTSRQFSWTPTYTQVGTYSVVFTVTDNGSPALSQTKSIEIVVGAKWSQTSGPEGGQINDLLATRDKVFAGTRGGIYISSDNGASWRVSNAGLPPNAIVNAVAEAGPRLLAGAATGVYASTDDGLSWKVLPGLPAMPSIQSLAVGGTNIYAGSSYGMFISTDNGTSWRYTLDPLIFVTTVAVSGSYLFAGHDERTLGFGGVLVSTDNGNNWTSADTGLPERVAVFSLLASGGKLFAGTNFGVYTSTNIGVNWTAANSGLPSEPAVFELIASGGRLYAGTNFGAYFSTDNGVNWMMFNSEFPENTTVFALAANSTKMFAGTIDQGIFTSGIERAKWTVANSGLAATIVDALVASGDYLFAGTSFGQVHRSTDDGASWTKFDKGLPRDTIIQTLAIKGTKVFAGTTSLGGLAKGVYATDASKAEWRAINRGLPADVPVRTLIVNEVSLLASVEGNLLVRGGVYVSRDDGANWTPASTGLPNECCGLMASSGSSLFVVTGNGVYVSDDSGVKWRPVANTGLPRDIIFALATKETGLFAGTGFTGSANPGGVFYTGTGLYFSNSNGENWIPVNNGLPAEAPVFALTPFGTSLFAGLLREGVYISNNNGAGWAPINAGLSNTSIQSMAVNGPNIFAGTRGNVFRLANNVQSWADANAGIMNKFANVIIVSRSNLFVGTLGSSVFRSSDQGRSWTAANAGLPPNSNIQAIVTNGATLWAAAFGDGVYSSTDQGASWTSVNTGLTNLFVNKLFLNGSTLYAGTDNGVFRSTDGGASWARLSGLANLRVVSFTTDAGVIYAGTDGGGVFRLNSDGASWTQVNRGLTSQSVTALGVGNGVLYAGTTGGGVCLSRDGGTTWTTVNNALPTNLNVYAFAMSGKKVFAGSIYGVFVTENQGQSWTQINAGLLNTFVTGLAVSGDQLFASTASGGVFVSRIPQQ